MDLANLVVYLVKFEDTTGLHALDIPSGIAHDIAKTKAVLEWLAASGAMCDKRLGCHRLRSTVIE